MKNNIKHFQLLYFDFRIPYFKQSQQQQQQKINIRTRHEKKSRMN